MTIYHLFNFFYGGLIIMIVDKFPEFKNGNYVVDVHGIFEHYFHAVVPHQMVHHWKNFWGDELITMEYISRKPDGSFNQPATEKIMEYITDTPQTIAEINRRLRADGYNTHFDIDIKAHIYRLKTADRVITQYHNKIMTVRIP